ncbi:MAG TPA: DUF4833 domain-containing protein [Polyangiaceae bacterium]|nr:DUF4833 domain-containing protein [Polyangiaceae bacterium]
MLSRRALSMVLAAAAVEVWAPREAAAFPSRELFTLGRSKNANVVKYAVRTGRGGRLHPSEPIEAYWLMLAEDGRREELTWTERQLAYGFSITAQSEDALTLRLTACPERELHVRASDGAYRAELAIAKQPAFLRRIFVRTEEGFLMPKVVYVEISGSTASGQRVSERIKPS